MTVLLGAIAAATGRVLSFHDPLRVAEDHATVGQLSRGRLELVIGKGNERRRLPMFGIADGDQRDALAEKHELLRRLWCGEDITWTGRFRGPLTGAPRIWHGSATTRTSAEPAAKWGAPLFSDMLERFAAEVVPVVRAAAPTTLWTGGDPFGGRPAVHGGTVADAVGRIEGTVP